MKKLLFSICLVLATGLTVTAQEKQAANNSGNDAIKQQHRGNKHKEFKKDLNLTEDQKKQLKANKEEMNKKMALLDKEQHITVKEMHERKAVIQKEHKAKNEAVFTADQKQKMAAARSRHEAEMKKHAEKKLENMKTKLALSEDQVAKIKTQQENVHTQMKAVMENETLDRESKKARIMTIKENAKEERKNILTADQQKKMEESKKGGHARESKK